ncbi:MAG: hypothetical protein P9M11_07600 [Candidatus Tenebribacter burtonii]|nr:hypothetical protein [Candidatus Tenebribacter burtonii]
MRNLIVILIVFSLVIQVIVAENPESNNKTPEVVTYNLIKENKIPMIKRSVDIRINRRVSEDELREIALMIKAKDKSPYERTFICYYLPNLIVDEGAWATTHFNPELEIKILGATENELAILGEVSTSDIEREIIGIWLDENIPARLVLFRKNGKSFIETTYKDSSVGTYEMIEKNTSRGLRFDDKKGSAFGDHYLINKNGELELRDDEGLIYIINKSD